MKRLEQLPEIADKSLGGLTAGQHLKLRIEKAAMNPAPKAAPRRAAWIPAMCGALAVIIGLAVGIPALNQPETGNELITTRAAGQGEVGNERGLLDLGSGDVTVRQSGKTPAYRSIWAKGDNGNFPLIGVEGRFYRMLTEPSSVQSSALGGSLGSVAEFTTEPALSGTDVVLSNVVALGGEVYAISGMDDTLVAAEVDGVYRVFQRISFNGNARKGREGLADTLQIAGHITGMELSDVGVITNSAVCEELFAVLTDNASYDSSGSIGGKQSLLITLDNGLIVQLAVKNDKLAACGSWSCPEFFEAFEAAIAP